jgi:hypothetical protein
LTTEQLKTWPKPWLQGFLQLACEGARRLAAGQPASPELVEAAYRAGNLKLLPRGVTKTAEAESTISYPGPPPDPNRPPVAANDLPILPATPAAPVIRYSAPRPAAVAVERELPLTAAPPRDKSWVAIKENDRTVYYKTPGLNEEGKPQTLGEGVSSSVYVIARVDNRDNGKLFEGPGAVLKVLKGDDRFGTAQEQIRRIRASYAELVEMKRNGARIEFPEILEFHEDAVPPYFIQRRIDFDKSDFKQVKAKELMARIMRPPAPFPSTGQPRDFDEIRKLFPVELQEAVVDLYFETAVHNRISWDLSLPNIYFRNVGGKWVAGVLDIDHIAHARRQRDDVTWNEIKNINKNKVDFMPSLATDGRELTQTFDFMEKMFEHSQGGNYNVPWIKYDAEKDTFVPVLIDPQLIAKRFAGFKMRLRTPVSK